MNICVVSSFEGKPEDFMSMIAEFQEEIKEAVDGFDIGVVNTGREGFCKVITMVNVINMDRFQEIMASPKMVEWDTNHKNTDIIYSLERMN